MRRILFITIALLLTIPASADDILLPVFAINMPGGDGVVWSSEVYVTNTGREDATVTVGPFLSGRRSETPPCLPFVQPFIVVPAESTVLWRTVEVAGGVGCPAFAVGGLLFHSDLPVTMTSRMVRHRVTDSVNLEHPLSGLGQEIDGVNLLDLSKGASRMILPAVGWHPNSCGPRLLETNVFFTNPGDADVRVEIDAGGSTDTPLVVNGMPVSGPYKLHLAPRSQVVIRLARENPLIDACLSPTVGSFTMTASGPVVVVASIVDRRSGDPRTSVAIPMEWPPD